MTDRKNSAPGVWIARALPAAALVALIPAGAMAHPGHVHGLAQGFLHPFTGLDHLLAMLAVGLWAGQRGGRSVWALPAAFLGFMAFGGALGMAGVAMPGVEGLIAASLLAFGLAIVSSRKMSLGAGVAMTAFFAVIHGHAHGTELAAGASAMAYAAGFVAATAALHAAGIAACRAAKRDAGLLAIRFAGAAIVAFGAILFAGMA